MVFKLKPNRVWRAYYGGKRIDRFYGKSVAEDSRFPEDWVASTITANNPDRPGIVEGLSICDDGELLKDKIEKNPVGMLGQKALNAFGAKTSILVKILDAAERLVIQVHPTIEFANEHFASPFGKTECWYMIDCEPNAFVYLGFGQGVTREKWIDCFDRQDIDGMLVMLNKIPVQKGDLLFVDGGVPHAIGGGCMMIELQEPTDLMVIPERKTPSGNVLAESKLHGGLGFDRMFDCFHYKGYTTEEIIAKYRRRAEKRENGISSVVGQDLTDKFAMDELNIKDELITNLNGSYAVSVVLSGKGSIVCDGYEMPVTKGDQLFLAADSMKLSWRNSADEPLIAVVCYPG